ncbi:MAG: MBL fold metallo-hydrolase [Granulosicoccus sp.]|nr:MBL fold metallo-hydrolase [Granulosicoccus sp.]
MENSLIFTLLGTGSSGGVPRVGNQWGNCDPNDPHNRRRRCAMLVRRFSPTGDSVTSVLIDAGADLREQLLAAAVTHLDGVLLTHSHADHIFGLDDLRQLAITMKLTIPVHMDEPTRDIVMRSFEYVFHQAPGSSYPPFCTEHKIEHQRVTSISGNGGCIEAIPLRVEHGDIEALGFRIGSLAYLPDMKRMVDETSLQALQNVHTLVVDALRFKPHPSHMNLQESLQFIDQIKPNRAILTNMHTDLDYAELQATLPENVVPGYDGMEIIAQLDRPDLTS